MRRPLISAFVAVGAAGVLAIWLVGHYHVGANRLALVEVIGYSLPLLFALLTLWLSRVRWGRARTGGWRTRRAGILWFLAAWALFTVAAMARWGGLADIVLLVILTASLAWVAYAYYGYRFARLTAWRAAAVTLLLVLLGFLLHAGRAPGGALANFANFSWFFVVIAIFEILRRRDAGREEH